MKRIRFFRRLALPMLLLVIMGLVGCTTADVAMEGTEAVYEAQASKKYYSHTVEMKPQSVKEVARETIEALNLTVSDTSADLQLEWDASEQNYKGENTWRYLLRTPDGSPVRLVLQERKGYLGVYPAGDSWQRVQFWSGGLPSAMDMETSKKLIQGMKKRIPDSKTAEGWEF